MNNRSSIVKDSSKLRQGLIDRWKELGLSHKEVAEDAQQRGRKITQRSISIYINRPYEKGSLNEVDILWLSFRYDIPVMLQVGIPTIKDVKFEIPERFNEKRALQMVKKIFG